MNFAVIPARGGSKRIPKKNIKPFAGKPLIAYSIEAAKRCGLFERVIVSTDSEEIAGVAKSLGAETPFMRPPELANDFTSTQAVLKHALDFMKAHGCDAEFFCCIYPTAPMISASELKKAYGRMLSMPQASVVYSVASFPYPIFRAVKINGNGFVEMFWPQYELTRSNDLPEAYHDAGQFYWIRSEAFERSPRLIDPCAAPHILPRFMVQDIDNEEDWRSAELLFEAAKARNLID